VLGARRRANYSLLAVSGVASGCFGALGPFDGAQESIAGLGRWSPASSCQPQVALRVLRAARCCISRGPRPPCEAAFNRLTTGSSIVSRASARGPAPAFAESLPCGATCPAVVSQMATPPPGTQLIDLRQFSSVFRHYYDTAETSMLRHPAAVDWKLHDETTSYSDPAQTDSGTLGQITGQWLRASPGQPQRVPERILVTLAGFAPGG
jgi:hypothetical protein